VAAHAGLVGADGRARTGRRRRRGLGRRVLTTIVRLRGGNMSRTSPFVIASLGTLATLSCRELNPVFCEAHRDDPSCLAKAGIDASSCTSNAQCTQPTPICDITRSMCAQCIATQSSACGGATPVCGDDDTCHGCTLDSDCASMTCLADGACAEVGSVLYAAPGGAPTASCMPTEKCSLTRAIALIDGTKSTIRLDPGPYDFASTLTLGVNMHLVGRGAVIDRDAGGTGGTLAIGGGAHITLDYLAVEGGDGTPEGIGMACTSATVTGREISVDNNGAVGIYSAGCALTLSHARIVGNRGIGIVVSGGNLTMERSVVLENAGGGISMTLAMFDLENNIIAQNGNPGSAFGAVVISQIGPPGPHVLDFNTIALNAASSGLTPGVSCSVIAKPLVFSNNLLFSNVSFPIPSQSQIEGINCGWAYSNIGPEPPPGPGNIAVDPQFVDTFHHDFHLQVTSPVRDTADPAATLATDIDGDDRPEGAGRDVGADEIK